MRRTIALVLLGTLMAATAPAQPTATLTVNNFTLSGGVYSFDIWGQRTGSTTIGAGVSSFYFDYTNAGLGNPILTNVNPAYSGGGYAPMTVQLVTLGGLNKIAVTIRYSGSGAGATSLSTDPSPGERLCTVNLTVTNDALNTGLRWDQVNSSLTAASGQPVGHTFAGSDNSPLKETLPVNSSVELKRGWNLIGVPLIATDMSLSALFPSATTNAIGWNGSYSTYAVLSVGQGYWIRSDSAWTVPITGTALSSATIQLQKGWNLIGALHTATDASSVATTPSGILSSPFYTFKGNNYGKANTLKPGSAYWVRASQAGSLTLQASALAKGAELPSSVLRDTWLRLEFQDSLRHPVVLALAPGEELQAGPAPELPPVLPDGLFDVRFASNAAVEALSEKGGHYTLNLSSVRWPLTVTARNSRGHTLVLRDALLNATRRLEEGIPLTLARGAEKLVLEESVNSPGGVPSTYEILQIYPNPFNPETTVSFSVRHAGPASVKVYSTIGQEVATLFEGNAEAGRSYRVKFNGKGLASGVYVCRLSSGEERAIKPLVLAR